MRVVIVGAGIAGLSAADELKRQAPSVEVVVLEGRRRAGGLMHTEAQRGLLLEHGPDSIHAARPEALEMIEKLGLSEQVVTGTGAPRTAFVARGGALLPLPARLMAFDVRAALDLVRSPLLSLRGKARALSEPLRPKRTEGGEESLASFVERRFGRELLDHVIEPLIGSVYGTAPERLSASAALPKLVSLESQHGSVALGMLCAPRVAPGKTPWLFSLARGMGSLSDALSQQLGARVHLGKRVRKLWRDALAGFCVATADDCVLHADRVILAAPAYASARLCEGLDAELAHELASVEHNALASVHLAFAEKQVGHALPGTGFVVPAREGRPSSACTWVSQKWPQRAPAQLALFRVFLRSPEASHGELVEAARADLRDLLGIEAAPVLSHVLRLPRALPRYTLEHRARAARIEHRVAAVQGLALCGNMLHGMGVPECIASGKRAAHAVLQ